MVHGQLNVVVLVQRFYGGVKLGTGGLVRAYGGVASRCLRGAETRELSNLVHMVVRFTPRDMGAVYAVLNQVFDELG